MNTACWIARQAAEAPSNPAVFDGASCYLTYGELQERVSGIAAWLRDEHDIQPGDRVGLFLSNEPRYFECLFAIWWTGAVVVPINAKLHPREATWIIENSGCSRVFTDRDIDSVATLDIDALPTPGVGTTHPVERDANDLAWLFYTSGTTGRPKGAMISHGNLVAMTACYFADIDSVTPTTHWLYAAPISHAAGFYGLPHFLKGARHVIPRHGFDPAEILALAEQLDNVSLFAAPTMVKRLVDHARASGSDGRGLRAIVYGGGPMYLADLTAGIEALGQRFIQIYGQGESPMTITALGRDQHQRAWQEGDLSRLASVGTAQTLVEVRVAKPDGSVAPAGEVGEVIVKGPTVMSGYWGNAEASNDSLCDGWLWTGDLGSMDSVGYLTLTDRAKDLIISGGSNVYPREVEEVLLRHPNVEEAACVGQPDREWGEIVVAFYVTGKGDTVDEDELDALCVKNIARFKRPKRYVAIDALPKNHYGKVLKTELRDRLKL